MASFRRSKVPASTRRCASRSYLCRSVAPVDRVRLGQLRHLLNPAQKLLVRGQGGGLDRHGIVQPSQCRKREDATLPHDGEPGFRGAPNERTGKTSRSDLAREGHHPWPAKELVASDGDDGGARGDGRGSAHDGDRRPGSGGAGATGARGRGCGRARRRAEPGRDRRAARARPVGRRRARLRGRPVGRPRPSPPPSHPAFCGRCRAARSGSDAPRPRTAATRAGCSARAGGAHGPGAADRAAAHTAAGEGARPADPALPRRPCAT